MDMKSLGGFVSGLYAAMLNDIAVEYPTIQQQLVRDYKRVSSAIDQHGLQFALITMPEYRKHFDLCLDAGRLTASHMLHFGAYRSRGPIPRLFKGLVLRVFDDQGFLRSDPDTRAVFWLRQLLGAVRKLKLDCPDSSVWEQTNEFFRTDASIRSPTTSWDDPDDSHFDFRSLALRDFVPKRETSADLFEDDVRSQAIVSPELAETIQLVADILVADIGRFNPSEWRARHGPGAVSDHKGAYKYDFPCWPEKLSHVFPYDLYGVPSHTALEDLMGSSQYDPAFESESPARLLAVPKTMKGPRLIASEPVTHQWCQQIVRDFLMTRTRSTLAGRFVNFRRQDLSQEMVRKASLSGSLATVDLSEASDRISCFLVERIFRSTPSVISAFKAVRTRWITQSLDRKSPSACKLRKFSTMGSALTFPVQSLVFAAIAIGCALHTRGEAPTRRSIRALEGKVRVFGDDIIVPVDALGLLGNTLAAFGLKVNAKKTFGTGKFRESCGEDAFMGVSVTTVNVNEFPRKSAPGSVASSVDVHNNLLSKGLVNTAKYVRRTVTSIGVYRFMEVQPGSGAFGWNTYDVPQNRHLKRRWNCRLHRYEARIHTPKGVVDRVSAEGYPGMLQYFTEAPSTPTSAFSTLGWSPRRPKSKLSLGWAALPM